MTRPSESALAEIDQLLAGVGLRHGRRKLMAAGFQRQPRHPAHIPAPQRQPHPIKSRLEVVQPPLFSEIPWLLSGFSTRTGGKTTAYNSGHRSGELNLGFTPADSRETVLENRRLFFREVAESPEIPAVTLRQIHSSLIRRVAVSDATPAEARLKGDGLMTAEPGLLLCIQTA